MATLHEKAQEERIAELEAQLQQQRYAQRIAELEAQLSQPVQTQAQQPAQQPAPMSEIDKEKLYLTRAGRWCLTALLVILILWITSPIWTSLLALVFAGIGAAVAGAAAGTAAEQTQTISGLGAGAILPMLACIFV